MMMIEKIVDISMLRQMLIIVADIYNGEGFGAVLPLFMTDNSNNIGGVLKKNDRC